jgi:predicted 3-demethylubiquinone-9 3-methyltransferase (glyoxalase superfamily)
MPKITPFLSYDTQTEEATNFYLSIFRNSESGRCRWLTNKFGLSWQIIPKGLGQMLSDSNTTRSQRVLEAMLQMCKIDLGGLKRAYAGE